MSDKNPILKGYVLGYRFFPAAIFTYDMRDVWLVFSHQDDAEYHAARTYPEAEVIEVDITRRRILKKIILKAEAPKSKKGKKETRNERRIL